jgi:hypothetical protein
MLVEEHEASVLDRSKYNPYFKTNARLFAALEFLVQLLQHLPDARTRDSRVGPDSPGAEAAIRAPPGT